MLKKIGAASAITVAMLLSASPAYAQLIDVAPIDIEDSNVNFCHNSIAASGAALTVVPDLLGAASENTQVGDCTVWEDVLIFVNKDDDEHHGHHGHKGHRAD